MKFTDFQRKSVSLIVLITFVALLHFWATPAPAVTKAGSPENTVMRGDNSESGFVEKESGSEPGIKKEKKFSWLFIGLGVVAIGVAVYFLVIKKPEYTLTVTIGANCTGTPAAKTKYKKGTVVAYNYTASVEYSVKVKLDGADVADSGSVTMDKDHTLTITAEPFSIVGMWSLNELYPSDPGGINITSDFTFVETEPGTKGTYTSTEGDHGTWTKNLLNVRIESDHFIELIYSGSFTAKNKMSGTCQCRFSTGLLVTGTWTATNKSSSAPPHTTASAQAGPTKQKKND